MMQYNMFNLIKSKTNSRKFKYTSICILSLVLTGCITPNIIKEPIPTVDDKPTNQTTTWSYLNGWLEDDITKAWPAWLLSCEKLKLKPEWAIVCHKALTIDKNDVQAQRNYFEENFTLEQLKGNTSKLTGYFEPVLLGSKTKSSKFAYPIYAYPQQWKINKPAIMPTREQITKQNLLAGNEIAYLDNPIDVAYLHVQGSGQLSLEDGRLVRFSYAGNNGYPFKSFAQALINRGEITRGQASISGIKQWAKSNPQKIDEILNVNPRFIFFSQADEVTPTNGAIGALGVPLTPQRSIAVDTNYVKLGSPVFISSINPNGGLLQKLVIAQDIGNAIKGQVRADFFWGSGLQAGESAGKTNYPLNMWVLIPKQ